MKKAILILVVLLLISTGVVYSQASITGQVDVDVDITNAFGDKDTSFETDTDNTEVDIKASVDDFSSITIQFRGVDPGTSGGIGAGDIFLESNIIGAFGWSDAIPDLAVSIKGGLFNPEPTEKGEVQEFTDLSDIIGTDTVANGGAALISVGYTDWLKVEGAFRFDAGGTEFGWLAGVSGEGSFAPSNPAAGKLGYSVYVSNQNQKIDTTNTLAALRTDKANENRFSLDDPLTEIGVGIQYSGLQVGTIRSAGGAIAEPGDVPVFQFGIGGQFVYFLNDKLSGSVASTKDGDDGATSKSYKQWQYGVNIATKFLTIIDLGFDLRGDDSNPLDAIGVEIGLVNPGENVGRIFGLALELAVTNLGGDTAQLNLGPELTLQAGSTGPKFRFGLPIDLNAIEKSKIELDVGLSF